MDREGKDGFMIDTPTIGRNGVFGHERIAYEIRECLMSEMVWFRVDQRQQISNRTWLKIKRSVNLYIATIRIVFRGACY